MLNIITKSHIKHFVRFIKDRNSKIVKLQGSPFHVVHDPAWGTYDDMHPSFEGAELAFNGLSAINGKDIDFTLTSTKFAHFFCHLNGKLSGGAQNKRLRRAILGVNCFKNRQAKSGGFPCSCLSLTNNVAPG